MPRYLNKKIWPHQITMKVLDEDPDPRSDWLEEKLEKTRWHVVSGMVSETYCFKEEKDMLYFLLVWQ